MTFIASVVARDGIAIIADSLVTRVSSIISEDDFMEFLGKKADVIGDGTDISITPKELLGLFKQKPAFTRDHAEKLIQYDNYTCITTAGNAYVNGKLIKDLIQGIRAENEKEKRNCEKESIDEKLTHLCNKLKSEVEEQLKKDNSVGNTVMIVSHYNKHEHEGLIYRIEIVGTEIQPEGAYDINSILTCEKYGYGVICEGQDKVSNTLLFGSLRNRYPAIIYKTANSILEMAGIAEDKKKELIETFFKEKRDDLIQDIVKDYEILKLRPLSMQEAVDFACVLMAVVRDFQKYTEDTPTVGGQIRIATIDKNGFKPVSGHRVKAKII